MVPNSREMEIMYSLQKNFFRRLYSKFQLRGLDSIRQELHERGITLEYFAIFQRRGTMRDLFHPSAVYEDIFWTNRNLDPEDSRIPAGENGLAVVGNVRGKDFGFVITHLHHNNSFLDRLCSPPLRGLYLDYKEFERRSMLLRGLENYFLERQAVQQPQYNYTYRSRTEIKCRA